MYAAHHGTVTWVIAQHTPCGSAEHRAASHAEALWIVAHPGTQHWIASFGDTTPSQPACSMWTFVTVYMPATGKRADILHKSAAPQYAFYKAVCAVNMLDIRTTSTK